MNRTGQRLGKRRFGKWQIIINHGKITRINRQLFSKGTRNAHANQFTAWAKMLIATIATIAITTGHQRVNGHPLAGKRAGLNNANRLMPKHQWRHPPFIMPMPSMHIRSANATKCQINQNLIIACNRHINITNFRHLRAGINKRLHFAVNPPSTAIDWPVT